MVQIKNPEKNQKNPKKSVDKSGMVWYINQAVAERDNKNERRCTLKIEQCKKTAYANKHQKRELEKSQMTLKILLRARKLQ